MENYVVFLFFFKKKKIHLINGGILFSEFDLNLKCLCDKDRSGSACVNNPVLLVNNYALGLRRGKPQNLIPILLCYYTCYLHMRYF